ncbi:hypothetical protein EYF80_050197 [Liparis tanakae]|uniref:Uncharacterized protein n=1 Tax=Liparis tanakae TaxID=230148 RepID=A0A4Z2FEQ8_9TELE|nr:hypothetical protein EYF80_050197 [Liparis tanakae]
MDEALYVRERCLMASRQGTSSSWKRGVPVISAASGRSAGLHDSMLRTMLSCTGETMASRNGSLVPTWPVCRVSSGAGVRALGSSSSSSSCSMAVTRPKSPTFTTSSIVKKMLEGWRTDGDGYSSARH